MFLFMESLENFIYTKKLPKKTLIQKIPSETSLKVKDRILWKIVAWYFYSNLPMNDYAKKNTAKIPESWVFLWDVEDLAFIKMYMTIWN